MKTNLPVIILNDSFLLPNNDLKVEYETNAIRNILDTVKLFHKNKVLVIMNVNNTTNINDLPKLGVIAKVTQVLELPNGNTRFTLNGIVRARVYEYLNHDINNIESILVPFEKEKIEENEETILVKKVKKELDKYIEEIPYISNSIINRINEENDLTVLTDVVAYYLPIDNNRAVKYLYEIEASRRVEMILEDIYNEFENYNVEKELDMRVTQSLEDNQREYILREKIKTMKEELGDVFSKEDEIDKLREKANNTNLPNNIKELVNNQITRYESLSNLSPEISMVRSYIDWLLELPFNVSTNDNDDLNDIKKKLDETHYGMTEVKDRIIEYLAVKKKINNLKSPIICLIGPPGVGKTSLAYSIASAMNRSFVKLSLGGLHDEAEIIGHRRSYLGANPGRIISLMRKAKSNNPVFLLDEIDKMTSDIKGDPASALLEVLDPLQNKYFSDNYLEIEFDLSNVLFITTANNIEDIKEELRDRLEIIELSGYTDYEKLDIAKNYLIDRICCNHGIKSNSIIFDDKAILKIINSYTNEAGVRELERQISKIIRKIVTSLVINKINIDKLNITADNLNQYLGNESILSGLNSINQIGMVNGLAYTKFGGDIIPIETTYYKGNGNLVLTGLLGDSIKESAVIALSYIKANYETFDIDYDLLCNSDIHINIPSLGIKKDGPSAGVTLVSSIISSFTNLYIDKKIAMTGEISLHGQILKVGGLKEKIIGAIRNNIDTIFIPISNKDDLDRIDIPNKDNIKFILVDNYLEIYDYLKESEK